MSSNIIYTSIPQLISSETSLKARIAAIDAVLTNMELLMIDKDDSKIYELDTTQTRIQKTYSGFNELYMAYNNLFMLQQRMITRLNYNNTGRIVRLVNGRNFRGNAGYGLR